MVNTNSKFILPASGIEVKTKGSSPVSITVERLIELGRERVAAGEDVDEVALDLAQWDAAVSEVPSEEEK